MVSLNTPICDFGRPAPDFALPDLRNSAGKHVIHTPDSVRGPKGLLVMFICNHCPYVKAVLSRIVRDCRELAQHGIGSIAIMPNAVEDYPEDGPGHMLQLADTLHFPFPYVLDETQRVAHEYGAVCTPDFFGFNAGLQLQYRGRLDASRKEAAPDSAPRELFDAMLQVARTGHGPAEQIASMGCSIKWRDG
jgi:peroxiredoxin